MADNRLKIRIRRILRSPLRSCKSKDQISDVVSTHSHHHFSPLPHYSLSPAAKDTHRLPLLSPDVNGRKCPPASPIISPVNNFYDFPKHNKKAKTKRKARYKRCAFQDQFPDCKYVNGLFSSDGDGEEEEKWRLSPCSAESLAVVKRSSDPYSDFRKSMVEMIVEKHIFAAKDLENLLRCFLSLNSYHHHKIIVQVFAEIWEAFFQCNQI